MPLLVLLGIISVWLIFYFLGSSIEKLKSVRIREKLKPLPYLWLLVVVAVCFGFILNTAKDKEDTKSKRYVDYNDYYDDYASNRNSTDDIPEGSEIDNPGIHYVDPYYRSNGSYVEGHYRSNPDGNPFNNLK